MSVHSGASASIPTEQAEGPVVAGKVTWFSSGVDEGPDCGLSVSLGGDLLLFVGELADETVRDSGINPADFSGIGWWVALEDGDRLRVVGAVADHFAGQALVDGVAAALREVSQ